MPIYELACKECWNQYERIVSFSSTVFPACPACGSVEVTRLLSKPAIHFKGSGWYINDSKTEDEKEKAAGADKSTESESESESKNETKSESKGESENETKSETKAEAKSSSASESKSAAKEEG